MPQIDGANGTWDYTISPSSFGTGLDKIVIKFTPKKDTKCKKIRLVQTCKPVAYGADDREIPGPPEDWYIKDDPPLYRPTKPDRVKDSDGRVHYIDHLSCNKEPYLEEDDPDKMTDGATQTLDFPLVLFKDVIKPKVKKIVKFFTIAAVCVETGEILGAMSWTSTSTPDQEGKIKVDPPNKETIVDDVFRAALKEFVKNHTKKKGDGKNYWWCPDEAEGVKSVSPLGTELPEGFQKKWLAIEVPQLKLSAGTKIGGGARFSKPSTAFAACRKKPSQAAIKFTWAGEQEKPIAGIVFATVEITAIDVAPHVGPQRWFANDFVSLRFYQASPAVIAEFLKRLREVDASLDQTDGLTVLTLIAGIGGERPASYTGLLSRESVTAFAKKTAAGLEEEATALKGLNYLALNLGVGPRGKKQPSKMA